MLHHAKLCLARRVLGHEAVTTVAEALAAETTAAYLDLTDEAWRTEMERHDEFGWGPLQISLHIPVSECRYRTDSWAYEFERIWSKQVDTYVVDIQHVTCTGNSCIVITKHEEFLAFRSPTAPGMNTDRWQHIVIGMLAGSAYDEATALRGIAMAVMHCGASDDVLARVLDVPGDWVTDVRLIVDIATDLRRSDEILWDAEYAEVPNRYSDPCGYENFINAYRGNPYEANMARSRAYHELATVYDHIEAGLPRLDTTRITWATIDDVLDEDDYWHGVGDKLAAR